MPSRPAGRLLLALTLFRALVTFICFMSIVACIAAIAHGALFQFQGHKTTTYQPSSTSTFFNSSSSTPSNSSRSINNGIIYPQKPSPTISFNNSQFISKDPREQFFFQYLTLFLLTLWILITCLKDWPSTRRFLYQPAESVVDLNSNDHDVTNAGCGGGGGGGEREYWSELKLGYSFPCIGASFVMIGSIMLAMNLGSNPMWRFFEWQTSLMDGFGYSILVVGVLYILLGLGPWNLRKLRDDDPS